jgi:hypothetical protein
MFKMWVSYFVVPVLYATILYLIEIIKLDLNFSQT